MPTGVRPNILEDGGVYLDYYVLTLKKMLGEKFIENFFPLHNCELFLLYP